MQPVNLKDLFKEIVSEINIIKGNRNFWLFENDIIIEADLKLLKRAFSNVILYAIHYTSDSGNIYIKAKKENNLVKISIKDNGDNIDKSDLPYIFNRFYSKNIKKGIGGLGLAIAKKIIQIHNGKINVFSKKR